MNSVKSITYGMNITDKKYLEVINKVNESKDVLLQLVTQVIELNSSNNNTESDSKNTSDDILSEVVNNKENTSDGKEEI